MADVRTLKLNLLADVDQFGRGMGQAKIEMSTFDKTVRNISKRATLAFAAMATAAGYAAIKIGKESVQAFIDDEASIDKFHKTLQNATGSSDDLIRKTDDWISSAQMQYGFADDKLRPAFETLARVTGNVKDSTELTTLAMDISRGTGKDLETVALALGKAYDGNYGSLQKLGVQLDDNKTKTDDFKGITEDLKNLFKDQASVYAETYAGKLEILKQRTGELKESVGQLLMPSIMGLVDFANKTLIPTLEQVAAGFSGKPDSVSNKVAQVGRDLGYGPESSGAYNLGSALRDVSDAFGKLFDEVNSADGKNASSILNNVASALEAIATGIEAITSAYDKAKAWTASDTSLGKILRFNLKDALTPKGARAAGGSVMGGQAYRVGEFGPEMFVPSGSGSIRPAGASGNVTININGIVDAESARRSIEKLLQDSARRTGAVSLVGATL